MKTTIVYAALHVLVPDRASDSQAAAIVQGELERNLVEDEDGFVMDVAAGDLQHVTSEASQWKIGAVEDRAAGLIHAEDFAPRPDHLGRLAIDPEFAAAEVARVRDQAWTRARGGSL